MDLGIPDLSDAQEIGRGGFAVVYRAEERTTRRSVAVKVIHTELSDTERRRFEREAAALGGLSEHPNIVTLYRAGFTAAGQPFLVMPYLRGGSLRQRLARGALAADEVVAIGRALVSALQAAHGAGLLHNDIKPDNVLVSDLGVPQLADFGIAKQSEATVTAGSPAFSPSYAAPEVVGGQPSTTASDVYGLGATLHALATGRAPFDDGDTNVLAILGRVATEPPADLAAFGAPPWLATLVGRMMAKSPADRPTLPEVAAELSGAGSPTVTAPSTAPVSAAAPSGASAPSAAPVESASRRSSRVPRLALSLGALAAIVIGVVVALSVDGDDDPSTAAPSPSTTFAAADSATTAVAADETTTAVPADTALAPVETTSTAPAALVPVLVVNASGRAGMGAGVAGVLNVAGYETEVVSAPLSPDSRVIHTDGFEAEAEAVAALFEQDVQVSPVRPDAAQMLGREAAERLSEFDLFVVIGTDLDPPAG